MISIGEKSTQLLIKKHESCNISLCKEKKIGYSLHFNNSLPLLHFTNVIAWEEQSKRKSVYRDLGLAEQQSFQRAIKKKKTFFIKLSYM